jgi:hypothetical protein
LGPSRYSCGSRRQPDTNPDRHCDGYGNRYGNADRHSISITDNNTSSDANAKIWADRKTASYSGASPVGQTR